MWNPGDDPNGCNHNILVITQLWRTVYGNSLPQSTWILHEEAQTIWETVSLINRDATRLTMSFSLFSYPRSKLVLTFGSSSPHTSRPPASIRRYGGAREEGSVNAESVSTGEDYQITRCCRFPLYINNELTELWRYATSSSHVCFCLISLKTSPNIEIASRNGYFMHLPCLLEKKRRCSLLILTYIDK
jgi:hypothetical protein